MRRWRLVSSIKQTFWQRWSRKYVHARSKWQNQEHDMRTGELVLIVEDQQPPQQWLTGRVGATHAGADGRVRVAVVQVGSPQAGAAASGLKPDGGLQRGR
ncbi:hypothetical protein KR074_011677, partial [Drosophila pseudoananassae]